jgi:death-on-curing family protein
MPKQLKIRRLAHSAGLDPDDVVLLLLEDGMDVESEESVLGSKQQKRARSVLRRARTANRASPQPMASVDWPQLDPEPVRFLALGEVLSAHLALVREFAGSDDAVDPPGTRDDAFLEAALFRPQTEAFGERKYPTVQLAASALLHSLILDHPFFNGNKRTALVSFIWFLRLNGHMILFTEGELYHLVVGAAEHKLTSVPSGSRPSPDAEVLAIHDWLKRRSRPPEHGDKLMIWHRLERILRSFGCTFDTLRGNRRNIHRGECRTQVRYAGSGMDVEPATIKKIRVDLELTDEHGIDSRVFYGTEPPIKDPAGIVKSLRRVLIQLAQYDRGEVLGRAG